MKRGSITTDIRHLVTEGSDVDLRCVPFWIDVERNQIFPTESYPSAELRILSTADAHQENTDTLKTEYEFV